MRRVGSGNERCKQCGVWQRVRVPYGGTCCTLVHTSNALVLLFPRVEFPTPGSVAAGPIVTAGNLWLTYSFQWNWTWDTIGRTAPSPASTFCTKPGTTYPRGGYCGMLNLYIPRPGAPANVLSISPDLAPPRTSGCTGCLYVPFFPYHTHPRTSGCTSFSPGGAPANVRLHMTLTLKQDSHDQLSSYSLTGQHVLYKTGHYYTPQAILPGIVSSQWQRSGKKIGAAPLLERLEQYSLPGGEEDAEVRQGEMLG